MGALIQAVSGFPITDLVVGGLAALVVWVVLFALLMQLKPSAAASPTAEGPREPFEFGEGGGLVSAPPPSQPSAEPPAQTPRISRDLLRHGIVGPGEGLSWPSVPDPAIPARLEALEHVLRETQYTVETLGGLSTEVRDLQRAVESLREQVHALAVTPVQDSLEELRRLEEQLQEVVGILRAAGLQLSSGAS